MSTNFILDCWQINIRFVFPCWIYCCLSEDLSLGLFSVLPAFSFIGLWFVLGHIDCYCHISALRQSLASFEKSASDAWLGISNLMSSVFICIMCASHEAPDWLRLQTLGNCWQCYNVDINLSKANAWTGRKFCLMKDWRAQTYVCLDVLSSCSLESPSTIRVEDPPNRKPRPSLISIVSNVITMDPNELPVSCLRSHLEVYARLDCFYPSRSVYSYGVWLLHVKIFNFFY